MAVVNCPLNSNPMVTGPQEPALSISYLLICFRQEGETGCYRTEENLVTPSPQLGVALQPLPASHSPGTPPPQCWHSRDADVTSLNTELQRTCPLRVPGGVQELLNSPNTKLLFQLWCSQALGHIPRAKVSSWQGCALL